MRMLLAAGLFAVSVAALAGCDPERVELARDGRTDYVIAVAGDARQPERFAAEELQIHLEKATGAKFPIVDALPASRKVIALRRAPADAEFTPEECRVRTKGPALLIEGEGDRGVAYGVYAFLERKLGARWFTSVGESKIDRRPTFVLEPFSFAEKQAFAKRGVLTLSTRLSGHPEGVRFLHRNRLNIIHNSFDRTIPEGAIVNCMKENEPIHHNLFFFLPPDDRAESYYRTWATDLPKGRYFKDHPEWYALKANGRRVGDDYQAGQLCFSNREMRRELTKNVFAFMEKKGGTGIFSVNPQDDSHRLCHCRDCVAMVERHQTEGAPYFDCMIELAKAAKVRFPEARFVLSAYHRGSTQIPPTGMGVFPDNIEVYFAPRDFDYAKPLTSACDRGSLSDLKGWCSMARTVNRDYPFLYASGVPPYHCFARVAASVRLGWEWGAYGCDFEHDEGTHEGRNFFDMQTWILLQLYRNPQADWHALAKEYCEGVYGPAADEILAIVDAYEEANASYDKPQYCMAKPEYALTAERLYGYQRLFAAAEKRAAGDERVLQRIRELRLGFDLETLIKYRDIKKLHPDFAETPDSLCDRGTNAFVRARRIRHVGFDVKNEGPYPYFGPMRSGHARATADLKPLPEMFAQFAPGDVHEIFPHEPSGHLVWVRMPDAALGYAAQNNIIGGGNAYYPKPVHRSPFQYGLYDWTLKRDIFRGTIAKADVVPDRFHFYKLGRGPVPNDKTMLFMGWDWNINEHPAAQLGGDPTAVYDVYASIKFEGPTYSDKSAKKADAFYIDRYVFVRVK